MALDFAGIGGGISSVFGAFGDLASAKGYKTAASYSDLNAALSKESTAIQQLQADRQLYKIMGGQQADIAGAGLATSGSAMDIIRSSAAQGALTKQLIGLQGAINTTGYQAEAASYRSMAKSAKSSSIGGLLKGGLQIAAAVGMFSDDRLKEAVRLEHRRQDGIGVYSFRIKGQSGRYEGLLASDVEARRPDAVSIDTETGLRRVNYDLLGVEPRVLEE